MKLFLPDFLQIEQKVLHIQNKISILGKNCSHLMGKCVQVKFLMANLIKAAWNISDLSTIMELWHSSQFKNFGSSSAGLFNGTGRKLGVLE